MRMSLEEFARLQQLPHRWLLLRRECNALVDNPQFWYRRELRNEARSLATEASDILRRCSRDQDERVAPGGTCRHRTVA